MSSNSTFCLSGANPVPLSSSNICSPGFYCLNNTAEHPPVYCPPTPECLLTRLQAFQNTCSQPQGTYEPIACKPGFYCPLGGKSQLVCPKGHYCPLGTVQPRKCKNLSRCPQGSHQEMPFFGFPVCGLLDLFLVCLFIWPRIKGRRDRGKGSGEVGSETLCLERQPQYSYHPEPASWLGSLSSENLPVTRIELEFRNVCLRKSKSAEFILSEIHGKAQAGSLTGIMGQSGSGKTTLVNILAGKILATSGCLFLNGVEKDLSKRHKLSNLIGFVPQDDIVHPHLTVSENILHSARIRLGGAMDDAVIRKQVDAVIEGLGLTKVQHSVVGSPQRRIISGGERKRVSIALELVAAPQVLILDEPTSGLDAQAALSIVELLRSFSRHGLTVICVIHQPRVEIFDALDNLLLLERGKSAYSGKACEAQRYFQELGYEFDPSLNPADLIMDIVSGKLRPTNASLINSKKQELSSEKVELVSAGLQEARTATLSSSHELETKSSRRMAAWYKQLYLCLLRDLIQQSRQITMLVTEIMGGVLTGLLIGLAIYELHGQIFQGIFLPPFEILSSAVNYKLVTQLGLLGCLAITFAAAPPSVGIFGEEILIFQRESHSGHSESAYFLGKVLSSLPRSFLAAFHYTTFYAMLATPFASFNILLVLNFFYFYCIYGVGSVVAALSSRENGPLICLLVSIVIAVFGGSEPRLPTVREWHMEWLWYMSPGLWYSEAFVNEHVTPSAYLFDLGQAAQETGYTFGRTGFDIGLMVLIGSVCRGIGCLFMVIRARTGWW